MGPQVEKALKTGSEHPEGAEAITMLPWPSTATRSNCGLRFAESAKTSDAGSAHGTRSNASKQTRAAPMIAIVLRPDPRPAVARDRFRQNGSGGNPAPLPARYPELSFLDRPLHRGQ